LFEKEFVGAVLVAGSLKVDRVAVEEGKFAVDDGGADGASDGGEHDEGKVYGIARED
jgi:hypothetical protein